MKNDNMNRKHKRRQRPRPAVAHAAKGVALLALLLHPSADPFAAAFVIPKVDVTTDLRMTAVADAPVALQKHPHFHYHNSDKRDMPLSTSVASAWESIVPKADLVGQLFSGAMGKGGRQMRRGILGADITVIFDDPVEGARQLLDRCGIQIQDGNNETLQHLQTALAYYQDIVSYASGGVARKCRARIVASRGPIGTKCPRWHLDHVPVRLIMSLVGPGCDYIPESISPHATTKNVYVDRNALNGLDMDDSVRANRIIVPDDKGAVHSKVGEAVVLMGREWDTVGEASDNDNGTLHAAAHKSPDLSPFEARVLLTVDLAEEY